MAEIDNKWFGWIVAMGLVIVLIAIGLHNNFERRDIVLKNESYHSGYSTGFNESSLTCVQQTLQQAVRGFEMDGVKYQLQVVG